MRAALVASQSPAAKSPALQSRGLDAAAVPQNQSPAAAAATHPSSDTSLQVINNDCYMVANDSDAVNMLDLDAFVLDDVMMTDETEVIDDQQLM